MNVMIACPNLLRQLCLCKNLRGTSEYDSAMDDILNDMSGTRSENNVRHLFKVVHTAETKKMAIRTGFIKTNHSFLLHCWNEDKNGIYDHAYSKGEYFTSLGDDETHNISYKLILISQLNKLKDDLFAVHDWYLTFFI